MSDPARILYRMDGRGYKAYQELRGRSLQLPGGVQGRLVKVQPDPFAPPSLLEMEYRSPGLTRYAKRCNGCAKPLLDYLYRALHKTLPRYSKRRGEGKSGELSVPPPGPIVLWRRALQLDLEKGLLRPLVRVGLPSSRRRVLAHEAVETLEGAARALEETVKKTLTDPRGLEDHIELWRAQQAIRGWMEREGILSFIARGSILPRRCGGCHEPLEDAVPFEPPASLTREAPTGTRLGNVEGMALPRGLTLVLGPAFHGKTTFAEAIAQGVWDHVRGDGRELVLTDKRVVTVQSENRRHISCVDLRLWFTRLPGRGSLGCFSTEDASGSTSMAASIAEYMEAGATGFVVDEDTSASNFIHRDALVERLLGDKTLVSLSENAPRLVREGYSLVIVATGVEDLALSADTILMMHEYRPRDVTREVKELYQREAPQKLPVEQRGRAGEGPLYTERAVESLPRVEKPKLRGRHAEARGMGDPVDLSPLWQLEEESQYSTLVSLVLSNTGRLVGKLVREAVEDLAGELTSGRAPPSVSHVEVRPLDVAFLLNRVPGLRARLISGR